MPGPVTGPHPASDLEPESESEAIIEWSRSTVARSRRVSVQAAEPGGPATREDHDRSLQLEVPIMGRERGPHPPEEPQRSPHVGSIKCPTEATFLTTKS